MRDSPAAAVVDPEPIVNADTEKKCPPSSTPQPSYTPQFSSASWILDLIKNVQEPLRPSLPNGPEAVPQTDDESKDVSKGHDGSSIHDTMTMPISSTHQPLSSAANIIEASQLAGMKRKREQDEEADDFTQNTMSLPLPAPTPALTPSATEILSFLPLGTDIRCSQCDGSSSDSGNPFIPCSSCSRLWHQGCVSLTIEEGDTQWASRFMCPSCLSMSGSDAMNRRTGFSQQQNEIERRRAKNLAALPDDVVPAKEELVGFWPGHASDAAVSLCSNIIAKRHKRKEANSISTVDRVLLWKDQNRCIKYSLILRSAQATVVGRHYGFCCKETPRSAHI